MRLIRRLVSGEFVLSDDDWTYIDGIDDIDGSAFSAAKILVPWGIFSAHRGSLTDRGSVGVVFPNDEDPHLLGDSVGWLEGVVLEFPAFRDGRAYSQARILRESLGFGGFLRARGDILRDQLFFMLRCGFDSFEIGDGADFSEWRMAFEELSSWYQPSGGLSGETILSRRAGRRGVKDKD